jgi:hypothetical protein
MYRLTNNLLHSVPSRNQESSLTITNTDTNAMIRLLHTHLPSLSKSPRTPQSFQIHSDLHLELQQQYATYTIPLTPAKNLILAGDIGRLTDYIPYRTFLQRLVDRFDKTFLVLGNHEFYGLGHGEGRLRARKLVGEACLKGKVRLLDGQQSKEPEAEKEVVVLGCTLWSHIPKPHEQRISTGLNDFRLIKHWTAAHHNAIHHLELSWLAQQILQHENKTIIVVTHHAPCIENACHAAHVDSPP